MNKWVEINGRTFEVRGNDLVEVLWLSSMYDDYYYGKTYTIEEIFHQLYSSGVYGIKIPDEKLELYYMNRNKDYEYKVDTTKAFKDQKMLKETKAIFAIIFRDYWATDYQRERILAKQAYDRKIREEELMRKYNPDSIFKKNN